MPNRKQDLVGWIEQDRGEILGFLSALVRARSPNPPGDTREAAEVIEGFLRAHGLDCRTVAARSDMPNLVATFDGGFGGRHLVLNGHIDVFPTNGKGWTRDPWGGALADGRIHGRGSTDMKAGTAASILTFCYLSRIRPELKGRLTLTATSDEETTSENGAAFLLQRHPELRGDCVLNGEPSGLHTIHFGERGHVTLSITVSCPGAHAGLPHLSANAIRIACQLLSDLETVASIQPDLAPELARMLMAPLQADASDEHLAAATADSVTVNAGVIRGGLKVNMIPAECLVEVDIRLPLGVTVERISESIDRVLARYPQAAVEWTEAVSPTSSDPEGEMVSILRKNVLTLSGIDPVPSVAPWASDAPFWRRLGVPAYIYGVPSDRMASSDESVDIEDFIHVVKTHVLSAYDYLS